MVLMSIMTPGTMSFFVVFSQAVFLTFASRIIDSACSMPLLERPNSAVSGLDRRVRRFESVAGSGDR